MVRDTSDLLEQQENYTTANTPATGLYEGMDNSLEAELLGKAGDGPGGPGGGGGGGLSPGDGAGAGGQRFQNGPNPVASDRQTRTLYGMAPLNSTHNPYNKFNTDDADSVDDGINLDLSSEPSDENGDSDPHVLPADDHILREFNDYMEVMSPMSEPEEIALYKTTMPEKWQLICNQKSRSPVFPLSHYVDNLRRHTGTARKRFSWSKRSGGKDGISHITHILRKLKVDLKMSSESFVMDFVRQPHDGVALLLNTLKDIQMDQSAARTQRKSRAEELMRTLTDEYDCLQCLKYTTRVKDSLIRLVDLSGSLDCIALCLTGSFVKSRVIALEIMTSICDLPEGHVHVMETMSRMRLKYGENVRFKMLMGALNSDSTAHLPFIVACVRLLNRLASCAENGNARVYLQHEMHLAGFEPTQLVKYCYSTESYVAQDLQHELDRWNRNYIDVNTHHADMTALETRGRLMREEVTRLQAALKTAEKEQKKLEKEQQKLRTKCEEYRERAAELQDTVEKLNRLLKDTSGTIRHQAASNINIDGALKSLYVPPPSLHMNDTIRSTATIDTVRSTRSFSIVTDDLQRHPPPPPPLSVSKLSMTVRHKVVSHAPLPLLNWIPMVDVKESIFEDADNDSLLREIDFSHFEAHFRREATPNQLTSALNRITREKAAKADSKLITFVDINRAKNLGITMRKIGLSAEQIRDAIDQCRSDLLPGEYAELLLKYLPNKQELRAVAQYMEDYDKMGAPEKFVFQLAQIDRLETKLNLIAFMGACDETITSITPQIECVRRASESVVENTNLSKVFQVILAFGNYMNSAKRGYIFGFRLESLYKLLEVRSKNRKETLLHYLVQFIEEKYPDLLTFYDDLWLNVHKGVSYQMISGDMIYLRNGVDLVKYEREKQPDNEQLKSFYERSTVEVTEIAENYRAMEDAYRQVCQLFAENYRDTEPDELFKILNDFVHNFKRAHGENAKKAKVDDSPILNGGCYGDSSSSDTSARNSGYRLADFTSSTPDSSRQPGSFFLYSPSPATSIGSSNSVDILTDIPAAPPPPPITPIFGSVLGSDAFKSDLQSAVLQRSRSSSVADLNSQVAPPSPAVLPKHTNPMFANVLKELKAKESQKNVDDDTILSGGERAEVTTPEVLVTPESDRNEAITNIPERVRKDSATSFSVDHPDVHNALATLDQVVFDAENCDEDTYSEPETYSSYL